MMPIQGIVPRSRAGLVRVVVVLLPLLLTACGGGGGSGGAAGGPVDLWTWFSGSDTGDQAGVYGVINTADAANIPGGRDGSVSWIDSSGNKWLFGGAGYDAAGSTYGNLNDLWKYDGSNWTWVSGSDTIDQPGVYGSKGVAAPGNVPGARISAVSWIDVVGISGYSVAMELTPSPPVGLLMTCGSLTAASGQRLQATIPSIMPAFMA